MPNVEKWLAMGCLTFGLGASITIMVSWFSQSISIAATSREPELALPSSENQTASLRPNNRTMERLSKIAQVLIPATPISVDQPRLALPTLRFAPKPLAELEPLRAAPKPLAESQPQFPLRVAHNPIAEPNALRIAPKPFSEPELLAPLRVARRPVFALEPLRSAPKLLNQPEFLRSSPKPISQPQTFNGDLNSDP